MGAPARGRARVEQKHAQLQASYARMGELEKEHAVTEERERIYRDLHDDVGAKLLSLVYRAQRPEDADLARSALRDLREVVSCTGADRFSLEEAAAMAGLLGNVGIQSSHAGTTSP